MNSPYFRWSLLALLILTGSFAVSAEMVSVNMGGSNIRGEVVKVSKDTIELKVGGKVQPIPVKLISAKDYYSCAKSILDPKDAKATFELGQYCLDKDLKKEADDLLTMAAALDKATYGAKVDELLNAKSAPKIDTPAKTIDPVKPPDKKDDDKTKVENKTKTPEDSMGDGDGAKEFITVTGPDGRKYKIPTQFMADKKDVAPRKPDEMKKFLDERSADLKSKVGGEWKMEETTHFYFFSNLKPEMHMYFKSLAEQFYNDIASILQHKEGDPLWNNKCCFYMLATRGQFAKFTSAIDQSPGAFNSGGYFMHEGRECHIVIPLYDTMPEAHQKREATNTLYHEGTHAFLQLTGNNVTIHSWLHEGMAQFIEFFKADPKNNTGRSDRVYTLQEMVRRNDLLGWEEGRDRPMGGLDRTGYAFAWSRVEFLYSNPDKSALPRMVKEIKAGKSDEEAMEIVFKMKVKDLEAAYQDWLKKRAPKNFSRE
ncbi:MAG: hypothetical protein HY291_08440 [Planctomycetes bacterium]|nr:hypothetical protein [Planctomycetota bacterium]